MDCPSPTTRPVTGQEEEASAMRERSPAAVASSAAHIHPPPLEPFVRRDKDVVEDYQLDRRDTVESNLSSFSPRRANTGWSIAASTATDLTDLNSPDTPFAEEGSDLDTESYASSPRRAGLFPRAAVFQKRLPFRVPPISCPVPDDKPGAGPPYGSSPNIPALRHRRLEQMAPRKPSLSRPPAPGASVPGQGTAPRWEGEGPPDIPEHRLGTDKISPAEDKVVENDAGAIADAAEASTSDSDNDGDSDVGDDDARPTTAQLDDGTTQRVCDQVLQHAFGVELSDLELAGTAQAAYESVSYCLDELSRIVLQSGLGGSSMLVQESALGRAGAGTSSASIWSAAGATNNAEGGGGGCGDERGQGGGDRKRSMGGRDGADPGGGKRRRGSSIYPLGRQTASVRYSCPFRKRNPVRFNIRDFQSCAVQPFPDVSQLKRHVKNFHKQRSASAFVCLRCRRDLGSRLALEEHLAVDKEQICNRQQAFPSADPEAGITNSMEDTLNDRRAESKIDSWEGLWRVLFPEDADVPEPDFVPPIELDEVYARFYTKHCVDQLRRQVQDGLGSVGDTSGWLEIFQDHIESVFEACRLQTGKPIHAQTAGQVASRRSSTRLDTGSTTPRRQGSTSSGSSALATPSSTRLLGHLERPLADVPFVLSPNGYAAPGAGSVGGFGPASMACFGMPSMRVPNASLIGAPAMLPPALQLGQDFGSHPPKPASAGALFSEPQDASFASMVLLGPHSSYLHHPNGPSQGTQGTLVRMPRQELSAHDAGMAPGSSLAFDFDGPGMTAADGFEIVPSDGEWMG